MCQPLRVSPCTRHFIKTVLRVPPNNILKGHITLSLLQIKKPKERSEYLAQNLMAVKRQTWDFTQVFLSPQAQPRRFCMNNRPGTALSSESERRRCTNLISLREAHWPGCADPLHSHKWAPFPEDRHRAQHPWCTRSSKVPYLLMPIHT